MAAGLQSDVPAFESVLPLDDVGIPDLEALEHMAQLEANADGSLPPFSEGGLWLHQPDRPAAPALLSLSHRPGSAGTGQEVAVGLTLGQANALSLSTAEAQEAHGLLEPGRVAHLSDQFGTLGLDIVCIHEARSEGPVVRPSADYWAFTSGCSPARSHGEEIWINRVAPLDVNGKAVWVSPMDVCVVVAEPTVLLISVQLQDVALFVLAAHAPPSSAKDRIDPWWDHLAQHLVQHVPKGATLV